MSRRLENKIAVITGTASGQGRAAAILFAAEGCKIVGCDLRVEGAQETVEIVKGVGGQMISFQPCDLTDPGQVKELIDLAVNTYGSIDILYNNAGTAWFAPMEEMTTKIWRDTISSEHPDHCYWCYTALVGNVGIGRCDLTEGVPGHRQ